MADVCCDTIVGGRVYVSNGDSRWEATGDVTIMPRTVERTADASSGGRMFVTEKAVPARARMDFLNYCNADPLDLFDARCHVDVTIVEMDRGFRHLFTKAAIVGNIEKNLSTGVVTGIEIATDRYSHH